jgi:transposase
MFDNILKKHYAGLGVSLSKSFGKYVNGAISACSFSTHEIARHVSKATNHDFNTSEKGLYYLLNNNNFQIDDKYWRYHINMVFDLMTEQRLIKKSDKIYLQLDFTSNKDHFLILVASIILNNRSIPIYFTMRNYPKMSEKYNHKKMEMAFIKGLKHVLSKKYSYVIVSDRGFSNNRFISVLEENGFDYLIRMTPNMIVKSDMGEGLMDEICQLDKEYKVRIVNWKREANIYRCSNSKGSWHLISNINGLTHKKAEEIYKNRFKIEKCFQDLKSSGFNIEKSKIRKYSNYKKLLAIVMVAHVLLVLLGHVITVKLPTFLKNSALMADVILAYFLLEKKLSPYLKKDN